MTNPIDQIAPAQTAAAVYTATSQWLSHEYRLGFGSPAHDAIHAIGKLLLAAIDEATTDEDTPEQQVLMAALKGAVRNLQNQRARAQLTDEMRQVVEEATIDCAVDEPRDAGEELFGAMDDAEILDAWTHYGPEAGDE